MHVFSQRLQEKLQHVQGSPAEDLHSLSLPTPHFSGVTRQELGPKHLPSYVASTSEAITDGRESSIIIDSSEVLSNISQVDTQPADHQYSNIDNVILHSDTIILVSSMVVMILMGRYKLFYRIFSLNRYPNLKTLPSEQTKY